MHHPCHKTAMNAKISIIKGKHLARCSGYSAMIEVNPMPEELFFALSRIDSAGIFVI